LAPLRTTETRAPVATPPSSEVQPAHEQSPDGGAVASTFSCKTPDASTAKTWRSDSASRTAHGPAAKEPPRLCHPDQ